LGGRGGQLLALGGRGEERAGRTDLGGVALHQLLLQNRFLNPDGYNDLFSDPKFKALIRILTTQQKLFNYG